MNRTDEQTDALVHVFNAWAKAETVAPALPMRVYRDVENGKLVLLRSENNVKTEYTSAKGITNEMKGTGFHFVDLHYTHFDETLGLASVPNANIVPGAEGFTIFKCAGVEIKKIEDVPFEWFSLDGARGIQELARFGYTCKRIGREEQWAVFRRVEGKDVVKALYIDKNGCNNGLTGAELEHALEFSAGNDDEVNLERAFDLIRVLDWAVTVENADWAYINDGFEFQ